MKTNYSDKAKETRTTIFAELLAKSEWNGSKIEFVRPGDIQGVDNASITFNVKSQTHCIMVNLAVGKAATPVHGDGATQGLLAALWTLRKHGPALIYKSGLQVWKAARDAKDGDVIGVVSVAYDGDDAAAVQGFSEKRDEFFEKLESEEAILDPVTPWYWIRKVTSKVVLGAELRPDSDDAHRKAAFWQAEAMDWLYTGEPIMAIGSTWNSLKTWTKVSHIGADDLQKAVEDAQSRISAKVDNTEAHHIRTNEAPVVEDVQDELLVLHGEEGRTIPASEVLGKTVVIYHGMMANSQPVTVDAAWIERIRRSRATIAMVA